MLSNHYFHLVSLSPWPVVMSFGVMNLGFGLVKWIFSGGLGFFMYSFLLLILVMLQWWQDIICESLYEGSHSVKVSRGISMGVVGFIVSEVFFFFSFFWMYFSMSLNPELSLGGYWPPQGFVVVNFLDIPLLNTLILLSSGIFITWSHLSLSLNSKFNFLFSYLLSLFLGLYFVFVQLIEYLSLTYDFSSGGFGCSFYVLTGFHGFHVIVGFLFLFFNFGRFIVNHFSSLSFSGFEYSIWYWHFVDVVWLFLYLFIYWWGG